MKNIIFPALAAILLSSQLACAQKNSLTHHKTQETQAAIAMAPPVSGTNTDSIPFELKQQLGAVLTAYYGVKNALVNDNGTTANTKATELLAALDKVETAKFSKLQHDIYLPLAVKIKFDAEHISETKQVAQQRNYFNTLSDNVFALVKTFNVNSEPVYQQFCPMANKGKGAFWMSEEKSVKNPYYGKSMLTCGKVTETLN